MKDPRPLSGALGGFQMRHGSAWWLLLQFLKAPQHKCALRWGLGLQAAEDVFNQPLRQFCAR